MQPAQGGGHPGKQIAVERIGVGEHPARDKAGQNGSLLRQEGDHLGPHPGGGRCHGAGIFPLAVDAQERCVFPRNPQDEHVRAGLDAVAVICQAPQQRADTHLPVWAEHLCQQSVQGMISESGGGLVGCGHGWPAESEIKARLAICNGEGTRDR